ncbi:unnamed protein product [Lactuca virosa]|uniref:Uncharacterized protein n=1 Tax=Lactuca virosa TaxID=75947 RepID=A0AAU9MB70_9ASTR|nr:unnamed protein product [Lactuca virosa]
MHSSTTNQNPFIKHIYYTTLIRVKSHSASRQHSTLLSSLPVCPKSTAATPTIGSSAPASPVYRRRSIVSGQSSPVHTLPSTHLCSPLEVKHSQRKSKFRRLSLPARNFLIFFHDFLPLQGLHTDKYVCLSRHFMNQKRYRGMVESSKKKVEEYLFLKYDGWPEKRCIEEIRPSEVM